MALPFYREIRKNPVFHAEETGITVEVRVGDKTHNAEYLEGRSASGVQFFFVRCDELFDRPGIYGEHGGRYEDNAARFVFFSKAAVELARRLTPAPQVLHVHDWAPALVPVYVHAHRLPFRSVLTIHHLAEQGSFWGLDFRLTNLPERFFTLHGIEFLRGGLPRPLDHTQPGRGHLKPGLLFGLIAREPGHPLALSGIRAIFVLLAYVVAP